MMQGSNSTRCRTGFYHRACVPSLQPTFDQRGAVLVPHLRGPVPAEALVEGHIHVLLCRRRRCGEGDGSERSGQVKGGTGRSGQVKRPRAALWTAPLRREGDGSEREVRSGQTSTCCSVDGAAAG